jgi:hypothetical protein
MGRSGTYLCHPYRNCNFGCIVQIVQGQRNRLGIHRLGSSSTGISEGEIDRVLAEKEGLQQTVARIHILNKCTIIWKYMIYSFLNISSRLFPFLVAVYEKTIIRL